MQYDKEIDSYISEVTEMEIDPMLSEEHEKIVLDKSVRQVIVFQFNVCFYFTEILFEIELMSHFKKIKILGIIYNFLSFGKILN